MKRHFSSNRRGFSNFAGLFSFSRRFLFVFSSFELTSPRAWNFIAILPMLVSQLSFLSESQINSQSLAMIISIRTPWDMRYFPRCLLGFAWLDHWDFSRKDGDFHKSRVRNWRTDNGKRGGLGGNESWESENSWSINEAFVNYLPN